MDKYFNKGEILEGYTITKLLGEGRYGIAYLGINQEEQKCVIKQLKEGELEKTKKKLFYEEKILKNLDSPSFPRFISKFKDEYREGYILEYIEGKTFYKVLAKTKYVFTKEEIYNVASLLLVLIEELYNKNIVHRDIRPPNVIIKENRELALIDFGLARFIDNKRYIKEMDYWYLGDFLIHLYYLSYKGEDSEEEKPWYEELDLIDEEKHFLKKLMGIDDKYESIDDIKRELEELKEINK